MASDAALGGVTRGYRRVLIVTIGLGLAGLIVAIVLGHYLAGVTLCGFVNTRFTISAAAKFSGTEDRRKRPIVFASLQRLGLITAVALLVAYAFRPDGIATLAGLALYHVVLLGNTSSALHRELRRTKA
jgi:peptidoglycan/LPS O-acetylase OafA/YrhL